MSASLKRLKMVGGYEEAELTAARVAACKMGFYVSPDGQGFTGNEVDSSGSLIEKASPGTFFPVLKVLTFFNFQLLLSIFADSASILISGLFLLSN